MSGAGGTPNNKQAGQKGNPIPPGSTNGATASTKVSASSSQNFATTQSNYAATTTAPPPDIPNPPSAQQNLNDTAGRRVRLRPKPAAMSQVLGGSSGLLTPLSQTNGMVFPYQPTITYSQDVTYTSLEIVHANQDFYSYSKTPALKLTVEGDFSVQNQTEGLYALACIHFLRTVSKMDFGSGTNPGQPPPVLLFDAYGQWMFNALPVILTQFSVTLPKDVDYVGVSTSSSANNTQLLTPKQAGVQATQFDSINKSQLTSSIGGTNGGYAWLPAIFSINVQLIVQNTPQRLRAFNLNQFRTGQLLTQGTWV